MSAACEFELLPWRRALRSLKQGRYQGAFLIGWNQERSVWLHFSPPLISTEYGFFVPASDPLVYRQPENIQGYQVATIKQAILIAILFEFAGAFERHAVGGKELDNKRPVGRGAVKPIQHLVPLWLK